MRGWRIGGTLLIDQTPAELELAYRREVAWTQGYRINVDARLLLLGMQRLLKRQLIAEPALREAAVVLGCRSGAMESYEAFEASLAAALPAPLAFACALPSIPLAAAGMRFGLRGLTYTLAGDAGIGWRALRQGGRLLAAGRAERAVVGCWEAPSATARQGGSERCRLLLAILETAAESSAPPHAPAGDDAGDAVSAFASCLRKTLTRHTAGAAE
jgi:3-oxoacyl-(acyl-carrier-protein) synthase